MNKGEWIILTNVNYMKLKSKYNNERLFDMDDEVNVKIYNTTRISSLPWDKIEEVKFGEFNESRLAEIIDGKNAHKEYWYAFYKIINKNVRYVVYYPKNPLYNSRVAEYIIEKFVDKESLSASEQVKLIFCHDVQMLDELNKLMEEKRLWWTTENVRN